MAMQVHSRSSLYRLEVQFVPCAEMNPLQSALRMPAVPEALVRS